MKKLSILIVILLVGLIALTACDVQKEQKGIQSAFVNDDGYLVLIYTDGTEEAAGYVVGRNGKDGQNGKDGKNGIDGRDGIDGKDGLNGIDGINGKDGEKGDKGDQGIAGPQGEKGDKGDRGPQGVQGEKGETGEQGPQGVAGVDGQDGRDGINGQDGKTGKDGAIIYVETEKHLKISNPTTYAEINKVGTHFDYLLVWNASNNTAGGCYDSYVLPYEVQQLPGNCYNYMQYTNYSCFNYKEGEDYSKYIVDCTNRTAPGRYKDPITGYEMNWEKATPGIGLYVLTNATIYSCHQSTMCYYGGIPVSQIIITYEQAYTPLQLLEIL